MTKSKQSFAFATGKNCGRAATVSVSEVEASGVRWRLPSSVWPLHDVA